VRIGVLGTLVWDRIDHPDVPPAESWGGISYSLAAAAAALPAGWSVRPIIRVGRDLAAEADAFLDTIPGLERPGGVLAVPEPNNRVHLRYLDRDHRHETLSGGVSGWAWDDLETRLDGLDALFVNLISGFELDLDTARRLRAAFHGPLYADLHSLLLDVAGDGPRTPRPLPERDAWLDAFDVVQVNERELALVAGDDDPDGVARRAVARRGGAVLVTRGSAGATWFAAADRPRPWDHDGGEEVRSGDVAMEAPSTQGDPTGCGDVWGATCFLALLRGERLGAAVAAANRAAGHNVDHQGAEGLYDHLRKQP